MWLWRNFQARCQLVICHNNVCACGYETKTPISGALPTMSCNCFSSEERLIGDSSSSDADGDSGDSTELSAFSLLKVDPENPDNCLGQSWQIVRKSLLHEMITFRVVLLNDDEFGLIGSPAVAKFGKPTLLISLTNTGRRCIVSGIVRS
jgi:hypothetical protein